MKLVIRDKETEDKLEVWLEYSSDNTAIYLMSKLEGYNTQNRVEFTINSDGSWFKCHNGKINNK